MILIFYLPLKNKIKKSLKEKKKPGNVTYFGLVEVIYDESIKLMGTNFRRLPAFYIISWNHLRVYEERYRSNFMINCIFYECTIGTVAFHVYIRGF